MAKTALSELQQQIEEVRREAFAAGYAAAMQAVRELTSRPAPGGVTAVPERRRAAGSKRTAVASNRGRRTRDSQGDARSRRPAATGTQRGTNAQAIGEILQSAAPQALRQAEIRKALLEKGIEISFTSLRHALGQLEAREAAEQVDSRTWRHRGGGS
jgi:hypothetical protein